jgi:hypothetical protein
LSSNFAGLLNGISPPTEIVASAPGENAPNAVASNRAAATLAEDFVLHVTDWATVGVVDRRKWVEIGNQSSCIWPVGGAQGQPETNRTAVRTSGPA